MGLKLKGVVAISAGSEVGQPKRWACDGVGPTSDLDGARPGKSMAQAKVRRSQEKECLLDCRIASNGSFSEGEHLVIWETEELRKQQEKAILSATDKALAEEAMRYDSGLKIEGKRGYGSSHLIPYSFDRAPEGESYDRSRVLGEINEVGPGEDSNGCWDLVEFTNASNMVRGVEWDLDETKIQLMSESVVRSLGSGRFLDWRALDADGAVGGLLICWDKRSLEILDWEEGQYSLSCRFKNVEDGVVWVFTGVYGPFTKEERECLWEEIGAIRGIWEEPWQGRITPTMRRFAYIIDDLGLVDLPLQRGVFTWSGGLNNQSWARLDRFLVSPSWLDQFSGVLQRRLPRPISDHFPLLLEGGGLRRGPSPFMFENMWLKVEGFLDLIRNWWRGIEVRGIKLKVWNREVFEIWKASLALRWVESGPVERKGLLMLIKMLSEDSGWKADIGRLQLDQISQQEAENLEIPFSENEIQSALMEMNGDKALGSDGFTMAFWQSCWEFVKVEILEMFKEFHEQSSFLKSLNNTFLVMIPKKEGGASSWLKC
ncbi:hypothetical protein AAG906_019039 [Vitis piasezkii]